MLGRQYRTGHCRVDRAGQSIVGWTGQDRTVLGGQDRIEQCWDGQDRTGQCSVV